MKTLLIVPILLTSLSSISKASVPPFSSITISPFYNKGETSIVVVTRHTNLHFAVFIQNDQHMNLCIASDTITKAGTYTYKYDNSYSRKSNMVFVRYYTDDPTASQDSQHFARDIVRAQYQYIEDSTQITSRTELVIVHNDGSYTTRKVSFGISGFDGYYIPSYYHKINLSDFRFFTDKDDIRYLHCNPSLVIKNYNNIFDDIEGANETVTFNLTLARDKVGYIFELVDDLYVNKETLKLSSTPKEGYVKTRHIYFPINDMQNQDKYECYFSLKDFGIDHDMLIHNFELRALRNTFGDCSNSKYCIIRKSLWLTAFSILCFSHCF